MEYIKQLRTMRHLLIDDFIIPIGSAICSALSLFGYLWDRSNTAMLILSVIPFIIFVIALPFFIRQLKEYRAFKNITLEAVNTTKIFCVKMKLITYYVKYSRPKIAKLRFFTDDGKVYTYVYPDERQLNKRFSLDTIRLPEYSKELETQIKEQFIGMTITLSCYGNSDYIRSILH